VTPRPVNGVAVPMMFGGGAPQTLRRIVRYGLGYTQGGGTPERLVEMMQKVDGAWKEAGREGRPEYRALTYFAFGQEAQSWAERSLKSYYGAYGDRVWAGVVKDTSEAKARAAAYSQVGCDELIFFATGPFLDQADQLAKVVL